MKYLFYLPICLFLLAVSMTNCKKKNEDSPAPGNSTTNTSTTIDQVIEKKWNVNGSSARLSRTSASAADYTSFEFNKNGNYYIIKADKSIIQGAYDLNKGDSSIVLNGTGSAFGTVYIDDINDSQITFRLVLAGSSTPIPFDGSPVTPVSTGTADAALNNTWSFQTRSVDGVEDKSIDSLMATGTYHFNVTFTEYGTFSTDSNLPNTPSQTGVWKWCDDSKTTYSTGTLTSAPTCGTNNTSVVSYDTNGNLITTSVINTQTFVMRYTKK